MSSHEATEGVGTATTPRSPEDQAIEDLIAVSEIPIELIGGLAAALNSEPGVAGFERVHAIASGTISDEQQALAAARVLTNFGPENVTTVIDSLRALRTNFPNQQVRITEKNLEGLQQNLPQLIRPYPSLDRYFKARLLTGVIGNLAQSVHLVCDLRPIFDETRERVEGLVPLTILRLTYAQQDGKKRELEIYVPQPLLTAMMKEAKKAEKKIKVLRDCGKVASRRCCRAFLIGITNEPRIQDSRSSRDQHCISSFRPTVGESSITAKWQISRRSDLPTNDCF